MQNIQVMFCVPGYRPREDAHRCRAVPDCAAAEPSFGVEVSEQEQVRLPDVFEFGDEFRHWIAIEVDSVHEVGFVETG